MRTHGTKLAALVCVLALGAAWAVAQDAEPAGRENRPGVGRRRGPREGGPRARRGERGAKFIEALKLTEEQKAPVMQILETHREAMMNWMKENGPTLRELHQKLGRGRGRGPKGPDAAKPPVDQEARQQAMAQMRELMEERRAMADNVLKQLDEHLTDEQMAVAGKVIGGGPRGTRRGGPPMRLLRALELTDEQKTKVRETMEAAREAARKAEPGERRGAFEAAWKSVVDNVLTDAQRAKLEELKKNAPKRRGPDGGPHALDLTEDQKAQIREIMQDARAKMKDADGREARREIFMAARKQIADEVLTPEQREKARKFRERRGERRGQDGPRRGRRGRGGREDEPVIVE